MLFYIHVLYEFCLLCIYWFFNYKFIAVLKYIQNFIRHRPNEMAVFAGRTVRHQLPIQEAEILSFVYYKKHSWETGTS